MRSQLIRLFEVLSSGAKIDCAALQEHTVTKMITFRLNRECREVAVNAEAVLYVCHYETGASALHFGKDCFIRVQGDLAEIVARLESASSPSHTGTDQMTAHPN